MRRNARTGARLVDACVRKCESTTVVRRARHDTRAGCGAKGQITLPDEVRRAARVEEGDYLEVSTRNGEIVLRPKKLVDADQAWFWTDAWQAGEREASEDIAAGRTTRSRQRGGLPEDARGVGGSGAVA